MSTSNPETPGRNTLWLLLSLGVALGLTLLVREPSFDDSQTYVLFLLFLAMGLWITEAIPPFAVGLLVIAFLVFALGNPRFNSAPQDIAKYANTFSSSVIWLMLGGFFLAEAMTKTRLDVRLFSFTLRVSGTRPRSILFGLMLTTMLASMLMSNTACTAMVIAAVMPLLTNLGKDNALTKALLVGVPLAASMGGMGTLIGTPPNLIASGMLENVNVDVTFVTWMYYGIPLAILLTATGWLVLVLFFVRDNTPVSLEFLESDESDVTPAFKRQRVITIVVLFVTLSMWMTSELHGVRVAAVSAIPIVFLTMTRVIQGGDVRKLPWDTLLLVAGGLSLGMALQETGLLKHYADRIAGMSVSQIAFVAIFAFATMAFSNIMSHTATSTVLIPLGMALVPSAQLEIALIIALASSTALMLPVSTPPNAIAYATGLLDQKDLRVGGIVIGLLGPTMIILWVLALT
jgi:solute carrier family 13 (sodium-dependent dicarboxylate transporter), member 2/3/5